MQPTFRKVTRVGYFWRRSDRLLTQERWITRYHTIIVIQSFK